jgi:hypothetical protein
MTHAIIDPEEPRRDKPPDFPRGISMFGPHYEPMDYEPYEGFDYGRSAFGRRSGRGGGGPGGPGRGPGGPGRGPGGPGRGPGGPGGGRSPHGSHDTNIRAAGKKIQIAYPKTFNGQPKNLQKFLQDAMLYLQINWNIYDVDEKKVAFILSLLDGNAITWKEQFLNQCNKDQGFQLGTYDNFIENLRNDFKDVDAKADALYRLGEIHQGSNTIKTHNATFNLLISQSGLDTTANEQVLVDYYCRSLKKEILEKCWEKSPTPTTLNQWMKAAQDVDSRNKQFARFQRIKPQT